MLQLWKGALQIKVYFWRGVEGRREKEGSCITWQSRAAGLWIQHIHLQMTPDESWALIAASAKKLQLVEVSFQWCSFEEYEHS